MKTANTIRSQKCSQRCPQPALQLHSGEQDHQGKDANSKERALNVNSLLS